MRKIYWIALVLLVIGGLNCLLVGLFGLDLVAAAFGEMSGLSRTVYVLVGISALVVLANSLQLIADDDVATVEHLPR